MVFIIKLVVGLGMASLILPIVIENVETFTKIVDILKNIS